MIRQEHKDAFIQELSASEKVFFLKTAREAIRSKRYRPSVDLFYYCYFMTMKERLKTVSPLRSNGMLRVLLVEGAKEIDDALKTHIDRLEKTKGNAPDPSGDRFIEYLSE